MSEKRKEISSISDGPPYAKRSRPSYNEDDEDEAPPRPSGHERPRNHPVYGMKNAFPGLDDPASDELFYGPAEDGLEYLRMVRSEANSLPTLFVATKTSEKTTVETPAYQPPENDVQNIGGESPAGLYTDGVYVAPPIDTTGDKSPDATSAGVPESDAQSSYYNLLRHRFLLLRSTLRCQPPASAIAALDDQHPISLPRSSKVARSEWRQLILSVDPHMVQLACMDMDSVLGVLEIMGRLMSENVKSGDALRVRRIGAWAWGLLGKCREVGQLGSEEVGEIRELGKRAATILARMRKAKEMELAQSGTHTETGDEELDGEDNEEAPEMESEPTNVAEEPSVRADASGGDPMDVSQTVNTAEEGESEALEAVKARLQARLQGDLKLDVQPQQPGAITEAMEDTEAISKTSKETLSTDAEKQTRAMLDMIITIVGEFYGQRDLLEKRDIWEEDMKW
ncbi:hypothetical protein AOR_1_1094014 [Paecilomyces variotii No. 5]|uniref:V-SNARE n=1 Tax=Byssochlamys spectabilis (strain No. 5 / NBRC 109023) TaxID=1356009 RepID=V5G5J6_BYSSN|nr:hypothetical protein AOR_1_1094014 [Paecilomyces variotii No. 5]